MSKKSFKVKFIDLVDTRWKLLYLILMVIFTVIIIACNVVTKHGWDIFPILMIVWLLFSLYIPKLAITPTRLFLIIVFFLVFDGVVDAMSTGDMHWVGPPGILHWDFENYSIVDVHPVSAIFLATHWQSAIPLRFLAISTYFVTSYYNVDFLTRFAKYKKFFDKERKKLILIFMGGIALIGGMICDYFNFLSRPEIPDFTTYVIPIGFWTLNRMGIRTIIMIMFALISFILAFQKKEIKLSTVAILIVTIYATPYIIQLLPIIMGY